MYNLVNITLLIILFIASIIDYKTKKISVILCEIFAAIGIIINITIEEMNWLSIFGGVAIGIIFILISKITEEAIGYGDSIFILICGIFQGFFSCIEILIFAFIISAITGSILWIIKKKTKKDKIAFIPFLMAGFIITLI